MAQSYKTLKENFVSNLSGGTASEINWVTAVAPVSLPNKIAVPMTEIKLIGLIPAVGSPSVTSRLLLEVRSASFPGRSAAQRWRYFARHHSLLFEYDPTQRSSGLSCIPSLRLTLRNRSP